jgi:hypothetical protein
MKTYYAVIHHELNEKIDAKNNRKKGGNKKNWNSEM